MESPALGNGKENMAGPLDRAHLTFLHEDCSAGVAALEPHESVVAVGHGTSLKTVAAVYDRRLRENRRSQSAATAKPYQPTPRSATLSLRSNAATFRLPSLPPKWLRYRCNAQAREAARN
jgi:hypothetical protein